MKKKNKTKNLDYTVSSGHVFADLGLPNLEAQQLEDLAKRLMPNGYNKTELKTLERKHARGYKKHPVQEGEFDDFYAEQSLGNL